MRGEIQKMKLTSAFRTQKSQDWRTLSDVYVALDSEFHFDCDPCPIGETMSLMIPWGSCNYVNPPYNKIAHFLERGLMEVSKGATCVFLLPSRTGTSWWHKFAPLASEIRFIRGRLQFDNCGINAPFDSVILIFKPKCADRFRK